MTGTISAPLYLLRGLQLIGWRHMQHALDYLYADGALREGTLVAINAEKMLAVEDSPEVRALIEAAEFKYADGISVVRSLRKIVYNFCKSSLESIDNASFCKESLSLLFIDSL